MEMEEASPKLLLDRMLSEFRGMAAELRAGERQLKNIELVLRAKRDTGEITELRFALEMVPISKLRARIRNYKRELQHKRSITLHALGRLR